MVLHENEGYGCSGGEMRGWSALSARASTRPRTFRGSNLPNPMVLEPQNFPHSKILLFIWSNYVNETHN